MLATKACAHNLPTEKEIRNLLFETPYLIELSPDQVDYLIDSLIAIDRQSTCEKQ